MCRCEGGEDENGKRCQIGECIDGEDDAGVACRVFAPGEDGSIDTDELEEELEDEAGKLEDVFPTDTDETLPTTDGLF